MRIYKTFSFLFIISLVVRLLDVVKNLIISSKVGVSGSADVFFALQFIPDYLIVLFGIDTLKGVINSEYSTLISKGNMRSVKESFVNILMLLILLTSLLFVFLFIFRIELVSVFFPGLNESSRKIAILISVFIFPVFFFRSISSLIQPYLNSYKKYYFQVILQMVISLTIIFFVYFPAFDSGLVYNISFGFMLGNLFYLIILMFPVMPDIFENFRNVFKKNPLTIKILRGCLTLLMLSIINQIYLFSRNYFVSFFPEGSLSSISYGYSIPYFVSTFTFNVVFSVLLTHFSSTDSDSVNNEEQNTSNEKLFFKTLLIIYYIYIPIIILFVVFSEKVLTIVFLRGNFNLDGIALTSKPFIWESFSLITYALYILPVIVYLSLKKYKKLMIIGGFSFMTGIILNYFSSILFGYYGISISNFITMGIYGILLLWGLRNYFKNIKSNLIILIRTFISFVSSLSIVYLMKDSYLFNYSNDSFILQSINLVSNSILITIIFILTTFIFVRKFTLMLLNELITRFKIIFKINNKVK